MSEQIEEVLGYNVAEVQVAAKENLDFFGALANPEDCTLAFPNWYHYIWGMVTAALCATRDFSKFAIGFPRGHGKTFWIKLLVVWAVIFSQKRFILIIGSTASRAENILSDVEDILNSYNIQETFGNWQAGMESDRLNLKKFYFGGRSVIIAAAGAGTSIRGMNLKNARPDFIICDDAQTKECAESESESKTFSQWFWGTLLKAKAPTGCTYLYVGNMYKDMEVKGKKGVFGCMLRNLQKSKYWKSFVVGAILQDGQALWEALQPLAQLIEEFQQDVEAGQMEIFAAEVLNDPTAINSTLLDFEKIQRKIKTPGELHQGNYIIIDPSGFKTGKKKSDDTAIGYFELYDAKPALMALESTIMDPLQTIHTAIDMAITHQCPLIICEDVAYQATLLFWFDFVIGQLQITGLTLVPINPAGQSKNSRILNYFKSLNAGNALLGDDVYADVVYQALKFQPHKTDNDDNVLDICAYSDTARILYGHLMVAGDVVEMYQTSQLMADASPLNFSQLQAY